MYWKSILDDSTFTVKVFAPGNLDADGEPTTPTSVTEVEGCCMNISEGYPPADWQQFDRRTLPLGRATLYAPTGTDKHFPVGARVIIPPGSFMPGTWRVIGPPMCWDRFGISVFMELEDWGEPKEGW